jgi:Flp pilus assembly protein TadB
MNRRNRSRPESAFKHRVWSDWLGRELEAAKGFHMHKSTLPTTAFRQVSLLAAAAIAAMAAPLLWLVVLVLSPTVALVLFVAGLLGVVLAMRDNSPVVSGTPVPAAQGW